MKWRSYSWLQRRYVCMSIFSYVVYIWSSDAKEEDFDLLGMLPPHQRKMLQVKGAEFDLLRLGGYTGAYCSDLVPSEGFDVCIYKVAVKCNCKPFGGPPTLPLTLDL